MLAVRMQPPDADGIVRAAKGLHVPATVLVMTTEVNSVPTLLEAGCDAVLLKPFAPNLLYTRVGRLLRARTEQQRVRRLQDSTRSRYAEPNGHGNGDGDRQGCVGHDRAEDEPGAQFGQEHVGVLAVPTEAGAHRSLAVDQAVVVDEDHGLLGKIRSAGITDLRFGNLVDEDWNRRDRFERSGDLRMAVPLPEGVAG